MLSLPNAPPPSWLLQHNKTEQGIASSSRLPKSITEAKTANQEDKSKKYKAQSNENIFLP